MLVLFRILVLLHCCVAARGTEVDRRFPVGEKKAEGLDQMHELVAEMEHALKASSGNRVANLDKETSLDGSYAIVGARFKKKKEKKKPHQLLLVPEQVFDAKSQEYLMIAFFSLRREQNM